ncbi:MAG: FtsH protease activity modulator HflK [Phycisphaerae bacterium]
MTTAPNEPELSRERAVSTGRLWRRLIAVLVVAAGLAYAASGFYVVQPDEQGVVRVFGKLLERTAGPGIHYAPPWPIARIDRPKTTEVRRIVIGERPEDRVLIAKGNLDAITASPLSDVLTGDTNILKLTVIVQYQVIDPVRFVLRTAAPDRLVARAAQAVLIETLAQMPVDDVLTTARVQLRDAILSRTRAMMQRYETGITLVSAAVESVDPPQAVKAAFNDVTSAEYDRERMIERAKRTADTVTRDAYGYQAERVNQAKQFRDARLARARGEAAAFDDLLGEYRKAPLITRRRMLLTRLAEVLPKVKQKYIIDDADGDGPPAIERYPAP